MKGLSGPGERLARWLTLVWTAHPSTKGVLPRHLHRVLHPIDPPFHLAKHAMRRRVFNNLGKCKLDMGHVEKQHPAQYYRSPVLLVLQKALVPTQPPPRVQRVKQYSRPETFQHGEVEHSIASDLPAGPLACSDAGGRG